MRRIQNSRFVSYYAYGTAISFFIHFPLLCMRNYMLTGIASMLLVGCSFTLFAQTPTLETLLGRWEVTAYTEQGVPVQKKQPAWPQARTVYGHVEAERALHWYGWFDPDEQNRREERAFQRWQVRDSTQEVARVAKAIATPYYAVFFADSTLALYNKDAQTGQITFPEARQFRFVPATMTLEIRPALTESAAIAYPSPTKTKVQVLNLTPTTMRLFLPDNAEVVELVKTTFSVP